MAKRKRVPQVLWRLFGNKVQCLSRAIISLIPKQCDCHSRGKCLHCVFHTRHGGGGGGSGGGDDVALSYLVRPDDPDEYKLLMNTCFVYVPSSSPPLPPLLPFSRRFSQLQIVERTIETCLRNQALTSNVICSDYHKLKASSAVVKLLSSSAWDLALKRVGDSLMDYLLMHTLIFICTRPNTHQQITGPPVNGSFGHLYTPSHHGNQKKRKRGEISDTICEEPRSNFLLTSHLPLEITEKAKLSEVNGLHKDISEVQNSEKVKVKQGKRLRLPSWQRRKRCKTLLVKDNYILDPSSKDIHDVEMCETHLQDPFNDQSQSKGDTMPILGNCLVNREESRPISKSVPLLCPCCSVFHSLSPVPKDAQINRRPIFYNVKHSSSTFLKYHVLHFCEPGFAGVNYLLGHIFGLESIDVERLPASWSCLHGSSCLYHSLAKSLKGLLRRAKRCRHTRLLKKHCPIQPSFHDSNKGSDNMEPGIATCTSNTQSMNHGVDHVSFHTKLRGCKRPLESIQKQFGITQPYCLRDEVVSFVWAVCRSIVPANLLGTLSTRRILRRNISRFIKLRRFEKFSMKQCMRKLEISKFPFVSSMRPHLGCDLENISHCALKKTLVDKWIFWLFAQIVVPLVQAHFYVTEAENGKQNVYYYRKPIWNKLTKVVTIQLKDQSYNSLDYTSVNRILRKRSFGFSKIRLCPKELGARPVANLKVPSRLHNWGSGSHVWYQQKKQKEHSNKQRKTTYFKAVNTVLRDVHVVLKDLRQKRPEMWGSSVSSYNDIYRKLCLFLRDLKEGKVGTPGAYIVVADVEKAFDTVNQDKLLDILNEINMEDKYMLQQCAEIFCRKKFLWVSKNLKLVKRDIGSRCEGTIASGHLKSRHTVVINQEHYITVTKNELMYILKEHLKHNVLKLGRSFFQQNVGIPQGSVLSSLLCSLYYGHLEKNVVFPLLTKGATSTIVEDRDSTLQNTSSLCAKYMLLRFVDDFLLLSTSKKQADSFLLRLQRGFREYNCYMNKDKICTNFDSGQVSGRDSKRFVGCDGASFVCWSGLLINCSNLEVQADYTRYLNDHLCSSLTVSCNSRPCNQLKSKLCAYMRPKCHPLFFDTTVNSPATVRLNVYQAFVLCAMKFHCYVHELSKWCKLQPRSCLNSIEGSLRYMYILMKRRMYGVNHGFNRAPVLKVTKDEVIWLGLTAYVRVLNRKQTRYKKLLGLLRDKLKTLSSIGSSSELRYAIDDSHNSLMWKIKY